MTIPPGHRFEATQALRQTLSRADSWGMLDTNPAKRGVDTAQVSAPSYSKKSHSKP